MTTNYLPPLTTVRTTVRSTPRYARGNSELRSQVLIKNAEAAPFIPISQQTQQVQLLQQALTSKVATTSVVAPSIPAPPGLLQNTGAPTPSEVMALVEKAKMTIELSRKRMHSEKNQNLVENLTNLLTRPDFQKPEPEPVWVVGESIIPVAKPIKDCKNKIAKTGYQFFCEHYCRKFGVLPPKGSWAYLPSVAIQHYNTLASRYNKYFHLTEEN